MLYELIVFFNILHDPVYLGDTRINIIIREYKRKKGRLQKLGNINQKIVSNRIH